ncbi:hypothetical protein G7054_g5899 [Neopestalotiopsis clavispora]|nr:hypothetical protein G7054_g5899 [Neopestalotiopsis clavispora]
MNQPILSFCVPQHQQGEKRRVQSETRVAYTKIQFAMSIYDMLRGLVAEAGKTMIPRNKWTVDRRLRLMEKMTKEDEKEAEKEAEKEDDWSTAKAKGI